MKRCDWCLGNDLYMKYHDEEWGKPVHDDKILYEFLLLESMQSGLNWITILKKRENFRESFDQFDYHKISLYDESKIIELLSNKGIIRHRKKIEAAINNAQRLIEVQQEFGSFDNYLWQFVNHEAINNHYEHIKDNPAKTELSDLISKDLKKRGFKFLGSTVIYAYLQAVGIVNDHIDNCDFK